MKNVKRIAIIMLVLVVMFSSVMIPVKKTEAFWPSLAIPGGITIGAGAYTLGALALAGLVGSVGYSEHSEAINAHALRAWENGSQLAKDSFNWSIEQAQNAGTGLVNLSSDFTAWLQGEVPSLAQKAFMLYHVNNIDTTTEFYKFSNNRFITDEGRRIDIGTIGSTIPTNFIVNGQESNYITLHAVSNRVRITVHGTGLNSIYNKDFNFGTEGNLAHAKTMAGLTTFEEVYAYLGQFGLAVMTGNSSTMEEYIGTRTKVEEAWESMRDAGLVLPVDSAIPTTASGDKVKYDPQADTYTDSAGTVYAPGDLTWSFPQPKVLTPSDNPAIPAPGVYVETPVANPALVGNPDIPTSTTITNVYTGEGVTTGNPPAEGGDPPPPNNSTRPPTKKPPATLGGLVTTKFPFSLPWDMYDILSTLNADPITPAFDGNFVFDKDGANIKMDIPVDFSWMDKYIPYFRNFVLISFMFSLVFWTRSLLGGAK